VVRTGIAALDEWKDLLTTFKAKDIETTKGALRTMEAGYQW
jgi:hypothetical protein